MVDILKDYSPDRSNTKAMKWHDLETVLGTRTYCRFGLRTWILRQPKK